MKGLVAADKVGKLMSQPSIANILLVPEGFNLPEELTAPVRVSIDLSGGLQGREQKTLSDQTKLLLELLGFREATGYDHVGREGRPFTRIVGQIPFRNLELLLKDLRLQPAGWFDSAFVFERLPTPLRDVNPVHVVEVLPDPQPMEEVKESGAREPAYLERIALDLFELVQDKEKKDQLVRVQVLFSGEPTIDEIRRDLGQTPTFQLEGYLGNSATGLVPVDQLPALASLARVSVIRRPRVTMPDVNPGTKAALDVKTALEKSGVKSLHKAGATGKGVRIAIVDHDFRGWKQDSAAIPS